MATGLHGSSWLKPMMAFNYAALNAAAKAARAAVAEPSLYTRLYWAWTRQEMQEVLRETHRGQFTFTLNSWNKMTWRCDECRQSAVWNLGEMRNLKAITNLQEQMDLITDELVPLVEEFQSIDCFGEYRKAMIREFITERLVAVGGVYDYDRMICEAADVLGESVDRIHAEIALMGFLSVRLPDEHPSRQRLAPWRDPR